MTGKDRYEERREQEHANEMARLKMQHTHYVGETNTSEVAALAMRALKAFLTGEAILSVEPGNPGTTMVRFVMPSEPAEA